MDPADLPPNEPNTVLFVGQHNTQLDTPVTLNQLSEAQALGYDFHTTPITTSAFHSKILTQLTTYKQVASGEAYPPTTLPLPVVPSLTPEDTSLEPQNSNSALIGVVSPWIDLGSADAVIASVSRQVLNAEIAYAAFCGVSNIVVYGPTSASHVTQYARDIREALGLGPYIQIHILLPMMGEPELDHGSLTHLSEMAEEPGLNEGLGVESDDDLYAVWDVWNTTRTISNYSQKLTIGMHFFLIILLNFFFTQEKLR